MGAQENNPLVGLRHIKEPFQQPMPKPSLADRWRRHFYGDFRVEMLPSMELSTYHFFVVSFDCQCFLLVLLL